MFDVGFSELIVIGLVALIVIGPERMPGVARTLGALLGRAQRYVNEVKYEIRREMQLEDLKKMQTEITEQIESVENTIHSGLRSAEDMARASLDDVSAAVTPPSDAQPVVAEVAAAPEEPAKPQGSV